MADRFVKINIPRSVEEQMLIYATFRRIKHQDAQTQQEARSLVADVGGEWGRALWAFLTTGASHESIVQRYRVPERRLRDMRREVYRRWVL